MKWGARARGVAAHRPHNGEHTFRGEGYFGRRGVIMRQLEQVFLLVMALLGASYVDGYAACPNMCSAHGRCSHEGRCECFDGYKEGDCSLMICPFGAAWADFATGVDDAHNDAECSNKGICNRNTGDCECQNGFDGEACARRTCPSSCNTRGKCQSLLYYAATKDPGSGMVTYPGPNDEINQVYTYKTQWDAEKIYGCNCDDNYYGPDCSMQFCPNGDDPKTTGQNNEIQKGVCKAGTGTFTLSFRGQTTRPIPYNARRAEMMEALHELTTITAVEVTLFDDGACGNIKSTFIIEFLQEFGDLPIIVPDGTQLKFPDGDQEANIIMAQDTRGSKESEQCSNRGICDITTGYCTCSTNYKTSNGLSPPGEGIRGDCGYDYQTVSKCPGAIGCSGHGMCSNSPSYRCSCAAGWRGAECSERTCPTGVSWFNRPTANEELHLSEDVECSDYGICDRTTGQCMCLDGFSGASCNRMDCPGEPKCSGHGQCHTMYEMAKLAEVNGVVAGFTYGDTPNNPATWDAEMVMGCVCNEGYHGYDCSLYSCPTGDNPDTDDPTQVDEQQNLACVDENGAGSVVLDYKGQLTTSISVDATAIDVRDALEALSNIRYVTVTNATDSQMLCDTTANGGGGFTVTFLTEHGDLPLISVESSTGDAAITITEVTKGTKENAVCSDRGICDESTGDCVCFPGYAGSNGMGAVGTIADCGSLESIIAEGIQ